MVQSFNDKEFQDYIKTLSFQNMFDMTHFLNAYLEDVEKKSFSGDNQSFSDAFVRWSLLMSYFGPSLLKFISDVENIYLNQLDANKTERTN